LPAWKGWAEKCFDWGSCSITWANISRPDLSQSISIFHMTKLRMVPANTKVFLCGLWLWGKSRCYLNNRGLLSKALSCHCDRLPGEICCLKQILARERSSKFEVWTSNFRENLSHIGPEKEGLNCFYCTMLTFERKLPKTGTICW